MRRTTAALVIALCLAPGAPGQDAPAPATGTGAPAPSVTRHEVMIGGETVAYTATAGYMELPDYEGKPRANVFYIAYMREGEPDPGARPLTFAFNGGPGSSSVWLHLGALGPRRVDMGEEGWPPTAPFRLVDNSSSWLDFTDLVFVDPVSTGYSRAVEGEEAEQFHGYQRDIEAVGDFIRLYVTRAQRWTSPKFLVGESYGTTRAAGLSGYLQETHGMYLSGLVLVSAVLNFQTISFHTGNDTPYWLFLPTYAATAWYHGRLGEDLQARPVGAVIDEASTWARTGYVLALARGDAMPAAEREEVAARLSRYTGLSPAYIERSNLRIHIGGFTKELLRDEGVTVGRLDSRYRGTDRDGTGARPEYDPSYAAILGPYTACLNDYVRRELKYENDLVYEILTGRVRPWSYAGFENEYLNAGETLRAAMARNGSLRVMVASGYYDLATPFLASDYTVAHLGLDAAGRNRVRTRYYEAGHMMYVRVRELEALKRDAAGFYGDALGR
jgi:carboxypeptidase C (cathepsin A)